MEQKSENFRTEVGQSLLLERKIGKEREKEKQKGTERGREEKWTGKERKEKRGRKGRGREVLGWVGAMISVCQHPATVQAHSSKAEAGGHMMWAQESLRLCKYLPLFKTRA